MNIRVVILRIGARLSKKCEGRLLVKQECDVKRENISWEIFAKLEQIDEEGEAS